MPIIPSSAYGSCEGVLNLARSLVNDARIPGGNVLTDGAPFTFEFLNAAYENIQYDLAASGDERFAAYAWLLSLPTIVTNDPATRIYVDDAGAHIITATGVGDVDVPNPFLPVDLLEPLICWERANGSTDRPCLMVTPKEGIHDYNQSGYLRQWEWSNDQIVFLGSTQSRDVRVKYVQRFNPLSAPTDPVPIRGVQNAAAFFVAAMFAASRGSAVAAQFETSGDAALEQFKNRTARRKQRTSHRRRPFSRRSIFAGRTFIS